MTIINSAIQQAQGKQPVAKPHILLCVSGSIAAFKAFDIATQLLPIAEIRVIVTRSAMQFVDCDALAEHIHNVVIADDKLINWNAESQRIDTHSIFHGNPVQSAMNVNVERWKPIAHIDLARWADIILVAPASANTIAKIAHGIADNELTTTILATQSPIYIAPAMNTIMLNAEATQHNLQILQKRGMHIIEPATGTLACGEHGNGKLADVMTLVQTIHNALKCDDAKPEFSHNKAMTQTHDSAVPQVDNDTSCTTATDHAYTAHNDMDDKKYPVQRSLRVLITAGATQEAIDPVRFITNHSTGKMGFAIADSAWHHSCDVTVIAGKTTIPDLPNIETVHVTTAQEMFEAVQERYEHYDIIVMTAAVSDFRPVQVSEQKIKKQGRETITLTLVANPDILAWLGDHTTGRQTLCGFAMETEHLHEQAITKLQRKHCDMLVANNLQVHGAGFAGDTNVVTIVQHTDQGIRTQDYPCMSKADIADVIMQQLLNIAHEKNN